MTNEYTEHRLKAIYPFGIPLRLVPRSAGAETTPSKPLLLMVVSGAAITSEETAFCEAIVEKGLKLPLSDVEIRGVAAPAVASILLDCRHSKRIIFGSSKTPGTIDRDDLSVTLYAQPLSDIRTDAAAKRAFWESLKRFG